VSAARLVVPAGHHPLPRADGSLPTKITYLTMRRASARDTRPPPSAGHLELVHIERPSCSFYRFLYDSVGRPWLWYERKLVPDEAIEQHLQNADNELHLLSVDHEPAGFFQLDFAHGSTAELEFFGLRPEFIGLGLGRWFLGRAIARAWQRPIVRLDVNTNTLDHPGALGLYRRCGFEIERTADALLQDPRVLWPELY